MESNYKPNSNKFKEEQKAAAVDAKKVQRVVTGSVKTKKKNGVQKFTDVFVSEDASKVKEYIFRDVLVPSIKKLISEMVTNGIDMILYGETGHSKKSSLPGSKVSYGNYYKRDRESYREPVARRSYSYDDIILDNRGDAEAVLDQMNEIIAAYNFVRVADLFEMVGITGRYTDNEYGWSSLRDADIQRVRDGYLLKLPKPMPID